MENPYDKKKFFEKYSRMDRSVKGLQGAGEWHELKKMLPDFKGKRVLDLGCGFGWHCRYAAENGAAIRFGHRHFGKYAGGSPPTDRGSPGGIQENIP